MGSSSRLLSSMCICRHRGMRHLLSQGVSQLFDDCREMLGLRFLDVFLEENVL